MVIVGGGISGLSAAMAAEQEGVEVVVLESAPNVGGVMTTQRLDGFMVEHGPNSFVLNDIARHVLRSVKLDAALISPLPSASKRFIVRDGRVIGLGPSPLTVLSTPLLSVRAKVRAAGEWFVSPRHGGAEESIAAFVRRRFGSEVATYLLDPITSGVYAGNPDRLSARHVFKVMHRLEQRHGSVLRGVMAARRRTRNELRINTRAATVSSAEAGAVAAPASSAHIAGSVSFVGGMGDMPVAIARSLRGGVYTGARVQRIVRVDDAWDVEAAMGETFTVRAKTVVVATPAYALNELQFAGIDDGRLRSGDHAAHYTLSPLLARLARIAHAPIASVVLAYRQRDIAHPLDGFGLLAPHVERRGVLGVLFNSSLFAGRTQSNDTVLMTAFVGGVRGGPLAHSDVVTATAIADVTSLLGASAPPIAQHVQRWERGIPQYEIGYDSALNAAESLEHALPGVFLAGSYRGGVSVGECIAFGWEQGARAAKLAK